jgi:ATP-dependent DNA helicase RecQ
VAEKTITDLQPEEILVKYWGHQSFRPIQRDIIESVLAGTDTLALLPTGGGKSICFQLPALMRDGICVVISPLIALMKDQVENLNSREIGAAFLHGNLNLNEQISIMDNCEFGKTKFLYVSPERLQNETFIARIKEMKVCHIAVDEAHCVSQWGYDFRPAYLKIKQLRDVLPDVPIIALTASATPDILKDISLQLALDAPKTFSASFLRPNLSFVIRTTDDKRNEIIHILSKIKGSAIVYVRSRKQTVEIANWLRKTNVDADFYHAGLSYQERNQKQVNWTNANNKVMVCTNAFGMGIDKPNVRSVIHLQPPDSLEAYYQEAGRAGRDGKKAFAVLLFNGDDVEPLNAPKAEYFPTVAELKNFYDELIGNNKIAFHSGIGEKFEFNLVDYCKTHNLLPQKVSNMLNALEYHELLTYEESIFEKPRVKIAVSNITLSQYIQQHKKAEPLLKILIRTSPGIFEFPITINENIIAKKLAISLEKLIAQLNYLHDSEVIEYHKTNDRPTIFLLKDRLKKDELLLDAQFLQKRMDVVLDRAKYIKAYCTQNLQCRSQFIAAYFGEKNASLCGICDICLQQKKQQPIDFESLFPKLMTILQKPLNVRDIATELKMDVTKTNSLLEWAIAAQKIKINEEGNYTNA